MLIAPFIYKLKFILDENKFLSRVERHAFYGKINKKIQIKGVL